MAVPEWLPGQDFLSALVLAVSVRLVSLHDLNSGRCIVTLWVSLVFGGIHGILCEGA